jgi:hypothetical protein
VKKPEPQIASVGRIVHYTSLGSAPQDGVQKYAPECRAAIITRVDDLPQGLVSLAVLNPEGFFFTQGVAFDTEKLALNGSATPGTWHWPERTTAPLVESGAVPGGS